MSLLHFKRETCPKNLHQTSLSHTQSKKNSTKSGFFIFSDIFVLKMNVLALKNSTGRQAPQPGLQILFYSFEKQSTEYCSSFFPTVSKQIIAKQILVSMFVLARKY